MKRAQAMPWIALALATIAGAALAKPAPKALKLPVDRSAVAYQCRPYALLPGDSTSELVPWNQRLSLAACRQEVHLPAVVQAEQLRPMLALLHATMAPSIAIYQDARENGPTQVKILAAYGLGMTYVNTIVCARNTIMASEMGYGGKSYGGTALMSPSQSLHLALEALLVGDRDAALAAFHDVETLAAQHPEDAKAHEVLESAVATSRVEAFTLR